MMASHMRSQLFPDPTEQGDLSSPCPVIGTGASPGNGFHQTLVIATTKWLIPSAFTFGGG
jgi:hypothetical protein